MPLHRLLPKGAGSGSAALAAAERSKVGSLAADARDGKKLCGAFNSRKGCGDEGRCPQWGLPRCGVIVKGGGAVCAGVPGSRASL